MAGHSGCGPHDMAVDGDIFAGPALNSHSTNASTTSCVIGIDFGRTKCEATVVLENESVALIPLELDDPVDCFSLASCVTMEAPLSSAGFGGWEVGQQAAKRAKAGHPYTVYDVTELLGKKVDALSPRSLARWAFAVRSGVADKAVIERPADSSSTRLVYPEQIAAMLLSTIKQRAQTFTGKCVTGAVVCVPATFNRTQRQALHDACSIAGLEVERLVVSSSASVVAYADSLAAAGDSSANGTSISEKAVVVVDCGGGSLDVTLARVRSAISVQGDMSSRGFEVQVEATAGDLEIGGERLTDRLVDHFDREAKAQGASPVMTRPAFTRQLRRGCALAKKILSTSQTATIDLSPGQSRRVGHTTTPSNSLGFISSISRSGFENLCKSELCSRVLDPLEQVLRTASVKKADVDAILLTGGSMQVPKLRALVAEFFAGQSDRMIELPGHTAAIGAALAGAQGGQYLLLHEPTPLALGIRSSSGDTLTLVPPSTSVPTRQTRLYYASCQGEIVFDVLEGALDSQQPATSPSSSNSSGAKDLAHCLGRVRLDGSRSSTHLISKLEVIFELDVANRLTISVTDHGSGRTTTMQVPADETCLSAEALVLAKAQLGQTGETDSSPNGSQTPLSSSPLNASPPNLDTNGENPLETLRAYATALQTMVQTNCLSVCASPGDLLALRSRGERAIAWLDEHELLPDADQKPHEAHEHLRQLRLLQLSSVASSAFAQLRQHLDQAD
ncbi:hypothetical protein BBJ28_00002139 [Nothophytophthora sp. Chile5]|nr:hypothetical protein BBJ28_00002139 [Nothophytophthora sp. Chile5]